MGPIVKRRSFGAPRKNLVDELMAQVPGMTTKEACTLMCIAAGLGDIQVWFPPYLIYIRKMRVLGVVAPKPSITRSANMRFGKSAVATNSEQR